MKKIGIYIHIPFCRSKCSYCDFYSLTDESKKERYIDRVIQEMTYYKNKNIIADTLFVGGGTPSLLTPKQVEKLILTCKDVFSLNGEITMEANPDSVSEEYLKEIFENGVNRISFGAQSAINNELSALGRRHNKNQITEAVNFAKKAGFKNISLDIMLGIPYQTNESLEKTLDFMTSLGIQHLSCYLLKIEEGTPFYRNQIQKLCADEDKTADFYLKTVDYLQKEGFSQYEISNFAKKGFESKHNLKYWNCEEYLGFGVASHSFYNGKRFFHSPSIEKYLASEDFAIISDGEGGDIKEQILLKLRLNKGVEVSLLPKEVYEKANPFIKNGLMALENDRLSFTPKGFLVSNVILSELLLG